MTRNAHIGRFILCSFALVLALQGCHQATLADEIEAVSDSRCAWFAACLTPEAYAEFIGEEAD